MKNQIQLITYVDRIGGKTLAELNELINTQLKHLFGGVHILPFFYPVDGEDAGFDPIDHKLVDPRLGNWQDVSNLSKSVDIMADLIVNHMSADSSEFKDFLQKGDASPFASLFLSYDRVFPEGAKEEDLLKIYRPRPSFPFTKFKLADNSERLIWTTFTKKQIDIDVYSEGGKAYLKEILDLYQKAGITMIRLDAAGYAIKKAGTSCFMIPETFQFISELSQEAKNRGIEVLVEIHSHYQTQLEIAKKVDYVYDFALPVLVLDALFNHNATNLEKWLAVAPNNMVTVLDTHDGIGIIDVASEGNKAGLIPDDTLDHIVNKIHTNSEGRSLKATGAAASNLDLYQVNCTYFEALGGDEQAYLLARAIQFFVPGIPQVYYVGLFGDYNDMDLLANTNVGRDINRHYYTKDEILKKTAGSLFRNLSTLMKLRNSHQAFQGEFQLLTSDATMLKLRWHTPTLDITLEADLRNYQFKIYESNTENAEVPLWP